MALLPKAEFLSETWAQKASQNLPHAQKQVLKEKSDTRDKIVFSRIFNVINKQWTLQCENSKRDYLSLGTSQRLAFYRHCSLEMLWESQHRAAGAADKPPVCLQIFAVLSPKHDQMNDWHLCPHKVLWSPIPLLSFDFYCLLHGDSSTDHCWSWRNAVFFTNSQYIWSFCSSELFSWGEISE